MKIYSNRRDTENWNEYRLNRFIGQPIWLKVDIDNFSRDTGPKYIKVIDQVVKGRYIIYSFPQSYVLRAKKGDLNNAVSLYNSLRYPGRREHVPVEWIERIYDQMYTEEELLDIVREVFESHGVEM